MTVIDAVPAPAPSDQARARRFRRGAGEPPPELGPRLRLVRAVLVALLMLCAMMLLQLVVIGSRQHSAAQQRQFDRFRVQLATGTAPIGPTDADGHELSVGTPVAYLTIPKIGLHEVVGEGTTSSALFNGPGHRRDTPLPGQVGSCAIYGRQSAFGGPFGRIDELKRGDMITVSTGQGTFAFKVIDVRHEGDAVPPGVAANAGRLLLATASGLPFVPSGVVRVDADLDGPAVIGPARVRSASGLPTAERVMGSDPGTLWALALWLQVLLGVSLGVVWAWHRWGRAQTWVVFLPVLLLVGLFASGEVARLLPNLM